ncbi:SDR family NAD(P)-dependent oxidoreductase [Beijerinckia indica]|uniref:Short-chain dehydrogenase/reductase SDR n=1 Tax=Beijerinckia indica subsp. indica (strain ATCC 9039 / DSM 1715 / NCIMB 8712) TaxID=395963 RepID=B2IJ05_BEII9|nr:SDR family oxidoreductase [Beijerinckia indica]ACB94768.1 short-chain dehydrogenase/reductase SDR [Beijerinckia indica subsp. indica ATCC 9039]
MKIDLSGKTALVTGSTAGIGWAAAKGLAESGATVIVNGRKEATVAEAVSTLRKQVPDAQIQHFTGDLGTAQGCAALVAAIPACDILINNLGIYGPKDFFETPDEDWAHFFEVNVMSGVRLSRAYLPGMVSQGWGRVVFVSSESAINIPTEMIHYGFSKTAQLSIARGLAQRVAGSGVTVNSVLPGPTLSEGLAEMLQDEVKTSGKSVEAVAADFVMAHRPSSIIRRAATVEEVANMIVYISSKQASATTGAALRVDGGVISAI